MFEEDNPLIHKKLREVSVEEGETIKKTISGITKEKADWCANQVGIDAKVALLTSKSQSFLSILKSLVRKKK